MEMRFLCDEMLKRLGHWLRAAGYDVLTLPDGTDDRELIDRALREHRLLLTRDRKMGRHSDAPPLVHYLDCCDLEDCVATLNARVPIDWHYRPFTRCMRCNTPLVEADAQRRKAIPPGARRTATIALFCPTCEKVYWDGSHVTRMRRRLDAFARLDGTA